MSQLKYISPRSHDSKTGKGDQRTNLPSSFNLSELNKGVSSPVECSTDGVGSLCLSLCSDDGCLSFLLGLFDHKLGSFGILLSNLLLLDGGGEFFSESTGQSPRQLGIQELPHVMWVYSLARPRGKERQSLRSRHLLA